MSLTTLGEVPRPVSRFSIENFGLLVAHFSICLLEKKVDQTESTVSFLATQLKNELVRNSRNCDSREAGKLVWVPLRE